MYYILNEQCSLRGWKNLPFTVEFDTSPRSPLKISEELMRRLSGPFEYPGGDRLADQNEHPGGDSPADQNEYPGGDSLIDQMIFQKILVPCEQDAVLSERQRYVDYGCLHFDNVIFSITGRCNYKCMHCSVNAPNAPMTDISFSRICHLLDEMKECGLKNVVLIGGEPLIRKDFLQVVDEVLKRGMFVTEIFSNGSLVTEQLLDELETRGVRTLFMLSFDGVGYHDTMRGVSGAEQAFYRSVQLLRERQFPVSCNMCITRESISTLWDTIERLSRLGVQALTVYPPVECGLWEGKADSLGVTTAMIEEEYPKVIERYVRAGYPLDLNLYGLAYFSRVLKKYALTPKWRTWDKDPEKTPACLTFTSELNISPEGILSPCYALMSDEYIRREMPDLAKMSLKQALTDSAFTKIMELTNADIREENEKCRACEYLPLCGGGCRLSAFKKTGNFKGYDPQMCEFFEKGIDRKFKDAVKRRHIVC